jgi:hypothetical protein
MDALVKKVKKLLEDSDPDVTVTEILDPQPHPPIGDNDDATVDSAIV